MNIAETKEIITTGNEQYIKTRPVLDYSYKLEAIIFCLQEISENYKNTDPLSYYIKHISCVMFDIVKELQEILAD